MALGAKYTRIKDSVLGARYDLSLAFLSAREMRAITRRTKHKNKVSNVLAFPLSKQSGEILICTSAAKPFTIDYLFIHALLHLRGHKHSATMEREEARLLKKFGLSRTNG